MRVLQFSGEELQADVAGLQFLGEHDEFDAAAESFVLADDEGDAHAGGADVPGELDGVLQLWRLVARVEIFSEKVRMTPTSARESSCASRDCLAVEARAYPRRTCPAGSAPAFTGRGSWVHADPGFRTAGLEPSAPWRVGARGGSGGVVLDRHLALALAGTARGARGAAQVDIGQSCASTRAQSFATTPPHDVGLSGLTRFRGAVTKIPSSDSYAGSASWRRL